MAIISVPKPLREKLGEEGSDALIDMLNKTQENQKVNTIEIVGEKFERRLVEEISSLRSELKEDIANLRADIIKWMFIFWVGQAATILGALAIFLR